MSRLATVSLSLLALLFSYNVEASSGQECDPATEPQKDRLVLVEGSWENLDKAQLETQKTSLREAGRRRGYQTCLYASSDRNWRAVLKDERAKVVVYFGHGILGGLSEKTHVFRSYERQFSSMTKALGEEEFSKLFIEWVQSGLDDESDELPRAVKNFLKKTRSSYTFPSELKSHSNRQTRVLLLTSCLAGMMRDKWQVLFPDAAVISSRSFLLEHWGYSVLDQLDRFLFHIEKDAIKTENIEILDHLVWKEAFGLVRGWFSWPMDVEEDPYYVEHPPVADRSLAPN